jgi:DNA-binding GntR family transcriptional regulator
MAALDGRFGKAGKPTKAGLVAAQIRTEILLGTLAPGEKINLDRLRAAHGVSVSLIREAVTRLAADGLIGTEEQKGYTVEPISLGNLAEITLLRMELEPLALRHSIERGDLDWESEVTATLYRLNRIERHPGDAPSVEAWEEAHTLFHRTLIARCEMPLLVRMTSMLHNMNDRYRRIFLRTHAVQRDVSGEHSAIAEATITRRADEAARLLRLHLERTGTTLRQRLTEEIPGDRG